MTPRLSLRATRQLGTLAGLFALVLLLSALTPIFLTVPNLLNVLEQTSINAVIAVGMTFVILSGGIDLSVGSVVALSGVVLGTALKAGWPAPVAVAAALGVGAACGLVNGLLVTVGRLPPFIATLGMMSVARGLALMYIEGRPVSGFDEGFRALATARPLLVPMPAIVAALVAVRRLFRAGADACSAATSMPSAATKRPRRLSGVTVRFHKTEVYGGRRFMSGGAAAILTARLNSAQPTAGIMYELDAIAAVVIGGTSLLGGEGSVAGTIDRRADHGRAAERAESARRVVVRPADRHRSRHHRRRAARHVPQATT